MSRHSGAINSLFDTPGPWTNRPSTSFSDTGPQANNIKPASYQRDKALKNVPQPITEMLIAAGNNGEITDNDIGRLRASVISLMREGKNPFPVVRAFRETLKDLADTVFTPYMSELLDFYRTNGYLADESEMGGTDEQAVTTQPKAEETKLQDRIRLTPKSAVFDRETKAPIDYEPYEIPGISKVNGKLIASKFTVKWIRTICYGYSVTGETDKIEPFLEKLSDIFGEATIERTLNKAVRDRMEKAASKAETDSEPPESERMKRVEGLKELMQNLTDSDVPGVAMELVAEGEKEDGSKSGEQKSDELSDESTEWIRATIKEIVKHKLNPDPFVAKICEMFSDKEMRCVFQNGQFVAHLRAHIEKQLAEPPAECLKAITDFGPPPKETEALDLSRPKPRPLIAPGSKPRGPPDPPFGTFPIEPLNYFGPARHRSPPPSDFGGPSPSLSPQRKPLMGFWGPSRLHQSEELGPPRTERTSLREFSGPSRPQTELVDVGGPSRPLSPPRAAPALLMDFGGPTRPRSGLLDYRGPYRRPLSAHRTSDFGGLSTPQPELMDFGGPSRPQSQKRLAPSPLMDFGGTPRPLSPPRTSRTSLMHFGGPSRLQSELVDFGGPSRSRPLSPRRTVPALLRDFGGPSRRSGLLDFRGPSRPLSPPRRHVEQPLMDFSVPIWPEEPEIKRGRAGYYNPLGNDYNDRRPSWDHRRHPLLPD